MIRSDQCITNRTVMVCVLTNSFEQQIANLSGYRNELMLRKGICAFGEEKVSRLTV